MHTNTKLMVDGWLPLSLSGRSSLTFVLAQHVEIRIKKIRKYGGPEPHGSTRNCISIRSVQLGPDSAEVVFQVNKLGCQVLSSLGWRIGDKLASRNVWRELSIT